MNNPSALLVRRISLLSVMWFATGTAQAVNDLNDMNDPQHHGPVVIASDSTYAINQFIGFVTDDLIEGDVKRGYVLAHTNLKTGKTKWLFTGGVYARNTRRISYVVHRLLGLTQDTRHLLLVSYFHLRYDNKPEQTIDPRREDFKTAESKFVVAVIEKKSGNLLDYWELPGAESTVAVVPEETAAAGVIEKTATGYSVLGTLFTISAAGKIVLATQ